MVIMNSFCLFLLFFIFLRRVIMNFWISLQSMWEDRKTGSKWVIVNRCYFPGDLPENVGRPSTPESNEVNFFFLHTNYSVSSLL